MTSITMTCIAPPSLFADDWHWQDAPEDVRRILNAQGGTPCDGGGKVGEWCVRCEWCGWEGSDGK